MIFAPFRLSEGFSTADHPRDWHGRFRVGDTVRLKQKLPNGDPIVGRIERFSEDGKHAIVAPRVGDGPHIEAAPADIAFHSPKEAVAHQRAQADRFEREQRAAAVAGFNPVGKGVDSSNLAERRAARRKAGLPTGGDPALDRVSRRGPPAEPKPVAPRPEPESRVVVGGKFEKPETVDTVKRAAGASSSRARAVAQRELESRAKPARPRVRPEDRAALADRNAADSHGGFDVGDKVIYRNPYGIDHNGGEVARKARNGNLTIKTPVGTTLEVPHQNVTAAADAHELYFAPGGKLVDVSKLSPASNDPEEKVQRALANIHRAASGYGSKRKPLTVRPNSDGSYTVIDGKSTLENLRRLGVARAPVNVAGGQLAESAKTAALSVTPSPFSTSKTSNWVARVGGLPAYIQNVAKGIMKTGKSESSAIASAIAVVKRWAAGGGGVHPEVRAAAAKAVAEWEAKRAASHAKSGAKLSEAEFRSMERVLREQAVLRLAVLEESLTADGLLELVSGAPVIEAAMAWQPELRRTASARNELERHDVVDGGQHVGMVSKRPAIMPNEPPRFQAFAVNGERVGDTMMRSRGHAVDALRKHLEEAPARVTSHGGKFLVANVPGYGGPTSYTEYPNEPSARHAAGLPPAPSSPEAASTVGALGEMARLDAALLAGAGIPFVGQLLEAAGVGPSVPLGEDFNPAERRGFHGRWMSGAVTRQLTSVKPNRLPSYGTGRRPTSDAAARYEGGVRRMSPETRSRLRNVFSPAEAASDRHQRQPFTKLDGLYERGKLRQPIFEQVLDRGAGVARRLGTRVQNIGSEREFEKAKADVAAHPDEPHVIVAALKGEQRAKEKIRDKYGGDASRLTDLVRGTILVPHADDLPAAVAALRAELPKGWTLVKPENRFVHEHGSQVHTGDQGGYRDISVLLRSPDGFLAEMQINTTHMWIAKEVHEGHTLYERTRVIREGVNAAKRQPTAREKHELGQLDLRARALYDKATVRSTRPRARRRAA